MMRTVFAEIVVLLTMISGAAHAGGIEFPTLGTEALGRGGAFVARADDGTAAYHNPAGFALQRGTQLTLGANVVALDLTFQRSGSYGGTGPYAGRPYPAVSNTADPTVAPMIALSSDLGGALDHSVVYAAMFPPSGNGKLQFPTQVNVGGMMAPAPQRYDLTSKDAVVAYGAVGVAYRLTPTFDIGGGFWWGWGTFDLSSMAVVPGACASAEDPTCDVPVDIHATDSFAPSGNFGAMWHPSDAFSMGGSLRLPVNLSASGQAKLHMPGSGPDGQHAYARLTLYEPLMVQTGARLRTSERSDLEADIAWENWSQMQSVEVDVIQAGVNRPPAQIAHGFRDTVSVRVGGEWGGESVAVRAGGFYDQGAAPDTMSRLDFAAFDKVGATMGLGVPMGSMRLDAAFAYVYQLPRDVAQSGVMPQNAINPQQNPTGYGPVGAGRYESSIKILSASLSARF